MSAADGPLASLGRMGLRTPADFETVTRPARRYTCAECWQPCTFDEIGDHDCPPEIVAQLEAEAAALDEHFAAAKAAEYDAAVFIDGYR